MSYLPENTKVLNRATGQMEPLKGRTDTERLDFLERIGGYVHFDEHGTPPWRLETRDESIEEWAWYAREAIDLAMLAEEQGEGV